LITLLKRNKLGGNARIRRIAFQSHLGSTEVAAFWVGQIKLLSVHLSGKEVSWKRVAGGDIFCEADPSPAL